ncbi:ABC transporter ATP-binding protein [Mycoplasma feriruminatoris]|uniref:Oligopeptide ABC transporter ATP-binding protein n=1 Tax=Mycoplasma feriruminatoris TaxID=1179777 RepID=A0AAQ3HX68_9MOLU|nr:ABC transporter ATP-binding protein [Mycoplasma feriruminatoris]UKS54476.1 ABC transporter family protein [Mycoplasma feriruminatoris]WFQ90519.1 Vitamin B12 import ATP-binding protein BtuD [Mycoplasma feriruminatoris]WFQ91338.1 oligopeptide ABC transporter ATP-binding protein [Mycoplasma feriruminatoris]WFQ93006.1 Vitamin B12 import ATP-binding protein BtuD [Mycoplasma feriruminatoris]WFQ93875.1 oligopeptide ABC transporter ATP-binding protein [Mycoplasma feriruminatoris]
MDKYYIEKRPFKKPLYRQVRKGTTQMLDAYKNRKTVVEIRNLDIVYGFGAKEFTAIKDLNLNVYDGEVLGLVGESGSGKSTIGRSIIGLTPHNFGQIKILDRIIPKNIEKGNKFSKNHKDVINFMVNKVQMIFQDPTNSLNPFKDVKTVVGEGLSNTKNAKLIYITDFDEKVYNNIVSQIKTTDKLTNKIFDYVDQMTKLTYTLENSYKIVYEDLLKVIEELKTIDNKLYTSISNKLNESKLQRQTLVKLSEKECKHRLIVDILKQVGLDESVLSRYPLEFSGGQQQRLGICRSVVLRPKLLIADEPISALDVSIQAQVINIFNELKKKYNLTILFIAHDLRMVEYISDRIAVINKGVLLEIGPTDEIINNPYHPYTRSLLDAVPSIENEKGSLIGSIYDHNVHNYDEKNQPIWHHVGNNHFVLATDKELEVYKFENQKLSK